MRRVTKQKGILSFSAAYILWLGGEGKRKGRKGQMQASGVIAFGIRTGNEKRFSLLLFPCHEKEVALVRSKKRLAFLYV